ncbi:small membrane protein YmiC [Atlantibacter subterraneus]|nr:small membrane protein YmiC [Atlantibacter subterranea]MDW2741039.1 small membrane protein YmiC [Atlantibacter subterranea]
MSERSHYKYWSWIAAFGVSLLFWAQCLLFLIK